MTNNCDIQRFLREMISIIDGAPQINVEHGRLYFVEYKAVTAGVLAYSTSFTIMAWSDDDGWILPNGKDHDHPVVVTAFAALPYRSRGKKRKRA